MQRLTKIGPISILGWAFAEWQQEILLEDLKAGVYTRKLQKPSGGRVAASLKTKVFPNNKKTSKFEVRDLVNLEKSILPFFEKHQLRTLKNQDFQLFSQICKLLKQKRHLHSSGVLQLIDLPYSMNNSGKNRRKTKQQLVSEIEQHLLKK